MPWPTTQTQSGPQSPIPMIQVNPRTGEATSGAYVLLDDASATGDAVENLPGGAYVWTAIGTWNGATATLQALGPDGSTWMNIETLTANGSKGVVAGENASIRVAISGGPPSALFSSIS